MAGALQKQSRVLERRVVRFSRKYARDLACAFPLR